MRVKKISIFGALCGTALICSTALAAKFNDFYFVGDSLTDIGNNPEYLIHRQPNGVNWSQFLAGKFGYVLTNSDNGGHNYAYVGAESGKDHGALSQTTQLLAAHPQLDSGALYSLWIGANDLRHVLEPLQPLPVILGAMNNCAKNVATILTQMHAAGGQYFLLGNIPNLANTPDGSQQTPVVQTVLNGLAQTMNTTLRNAVNKLPFDVIQIDDYGLLNDVVAHPRDFGFTHTTDQMCKVAGDPRCNGYLFWDGIHPAQPGQSMIADYAYSVLVAPDYYAYLAEAPFSLERSNHSNIKNEIWQQGILGALDKPYLFLDGNYSPYRSIAHTDDRPNNKANFGGGTLGVLYPATRFITFGGAFNYAQDTTNVSGDSFRFKTNATNGALFVDIHKSQAYATATLDLGYLNFADIKRHVHIGQKQITAFGSTSGWIYGATLDGGYQFILPGNIWHTGPIADIDCQKVKVKGYTEDGAAGENYALLDFNNQSMTSLTTALGWELDFKQPVSNYIFNGNFFATGNREWLNGDRNIGFHVVSIAGSHASLPVSTPTYYFLNAGANFGLTFANIYTVSVGYSGIFGQNKVQQHLINAGLAVAL